MCPLLTQKTGVPNYSYNEGHKRYQRPVSAAPTQQGKQCYPVIDPNSRTHVIDYSASFKRKPIPKPHVAYTSEMSKRAFDKRPSDWVGKKATMWNAHQPQRREQFFETNKEIHHNSIYTQSQWNRAAETGVDPLKSTTRYRTGIQQ